MTFENILYFPLDLEHLRTSRSVTDPLKIGFHGYQGVRNNPPLRSKTGPLGRVIYFSPNLDFGFFSRASIFGLIWPKISGSSIFLKILDFWTILMLIYTVNSIVFAGSIIFHKKNTFLGAIYFWPNLTSWKFSGASIFSQISRILGGGIYYRGGSISNSLV